MLLTLATSCLFSAGCVATQYEKSFSVTKDANGNVTSTTETERIIQPNQTGYPMTMEHFKDTQPGSQTGTKVNSTR